MFVEYAGLRIPAKSVQLRSRQQDAPPVRQGPSGRSDRIGVRQYKLQSLHKGIGVIRGSETADALRFKSSQGLQAHLPFGLFLPYVSTDQGLNSTNISTFRAANKRVHTVNSTLGQSKLRFYAAVGDELHRNTSDSNAAIADSTLNLTNNVTSMFEGVFNSTRYLTLCTDGSTNDVSGTVDPTATPPVLSTIVALNAGDWLMGAHMPTLGPGYNIFIGEYLGVNGIWYVDTTSALATALEPVVLTETKSVRNFDATYEDSGFQSGNQATYLRVDPLVVLGTVPTNVVNVLSSNDQYMDIVTTAVASTNNFHFFMSFLFAEIIPASATVTGIEVNIERNETDAGTNATDYVVMLCTLQDQGFGDTAASLVPYHFAEYHGINHAVSTEWNLTTDTTLTYGANPYMWSAGEITAAQLRADNFGVAYAWTQTATGTARVDHISMKVYWQMPGTQAAIPQGGFIVGPDPADPNTLYVVAPEFQDDTTAVTVPRILWRLEFAFDGAGNRPTVTTTKVYTGLHHIECACFALGGLVVGGDTKSGVGKSIRLVSTGSAAPTDLGFNSGGNSYTEAWGVANLYSGGPRILLADMVLEGATVAQTWMYFDGAWTPNGTRDTIAAFPLAIAGNPQICIELSTRYRYYPDGTTTNVVRVFQPRSLLSDPIYSNTTEVKADGVLTITLPDLDLLGPEEADKLLLKAWCLSRDVSASSTIRLRYSTDGGSNFTTWTTFTSYGSSSTLSVPISFRSLVLEIGLNHTASSANTPNGLPILIEGWSGWVQQRQVVCELEPDPDIDAEFMGVYPGGIDELWATLTALSIPVNTLEAGTVSFPATWKLEESTYIPRTTSANAIGQPQKRLILSFDEVVS